MKYFLNMILATFLVVMFTFSIASSQNSVKIKKETLKVLYVGGSADISSYAAKKPTPEEKEASVLKRMKSFETLLKSYFTDVTVIRDKDYREAQSKNFDVTILDGTPPVRVPLYTEKDDKGNYTVYKNAGYISEDFDSPMVTIAEASDRIGRRIGLKLDWYCLCLDAQAYNFDIKHPIFNYPFKVKLTTEVLPTPKPAMEFQKYYKEAIPPTQKMWRVQTQGCMTNQDFRIGMVCRPWGFGDSPETEVISGGVSLKSPDAIAIGRHGNFFHWGFAASPEFMTEEARVVFANAVAYAATLKNERVISRKYDDRKTTRYEMVYVYARAHEDSALLAANLPYLYKDEKSRAGLTVDADAKYLGIANNNHAILDKAISMLEKGENKDLAQRILDRYTLATFKTPGQWREWYEKYKNKMFFSESGGFYFLVNSKEKGVYGNDYSLMQIERAGRDMVVEATNNINPVNVSTKLVRLENGELAAIARVKIEKGFHIYAKVSEKEPYINTEVAFESTEGFVKCSEINIPASSKYGENGTFIYEGDLLFYQKFVGTGKEEFRLKFSYQCCDDQICFPPVDKELSVIFK